MSTHLPADWQPVPTVKRIDPHVRIGHVHLKVSNLRLRWHSIAMYWDFN